MTFRGGELVVGSFRSIRAFKSVSVIPFKSFFFKAEDDPIMPSDWTHKLRALSHHTEYEIGPTYKAECSSMEFNENRLRELFQIPADTTIINIVELFPSRGIPIQITISNRTGDIERITKHITRDEANGLWVKTTHEAPQIHCTCGFYSFYSYKEMRSLIPRYIIGLTFDFIYGVVENTGRVVHCEHGLRSEKIRILATTNYDGISKMLEKYPLSKFE